MDIEAEKLEIMELVLKTENETLLKAIKSIFSSTLKEKSNSLKINKKSKKIMNGTNNKGNFSFGWEGGLKELKNEFDGVKLQHHISSLRK